MNGLDMLTFERRDRMNQIDHMLPTWYIFSKNMTDEEEDEWIRRSKVVHEIYLDTYYPEDETLESFNKLALVDMRK